MKSAELTTDIPSDLEDINVLALVATNVGDNFLDVRDKLEEWNCTVTTIGRTASVFTHGGTSVTVDVQLANFDIDEDLSNYDAFFVPSGAWWLGIASDPTYTDFIKDAYDAGIFVGSMCVGCGILGPADIVEGKKLLCHANSAYLIRDAGGDVIDGYDIVSDERIVTGAIGSGVSGHENAPYAKFSQTLIKEILGLSYLDQYAIEEVEDDPVNTHKISVSTQSLYELDHLLTGNERNISGVEVVFYPKNDRKEVIEIDLVEIAENSFEGYIDEEVDGRYTVKIEISNDLDELEIVTVDEAIWINSIPGYSIWVIMSIGISVIGILLLITRKRLVRN